MAEELGNGDMAPLKESEVDDAFVDIAKDLRTNTVNFTPKETEILDYYDELQELRLENALMEAQISQAKAPTSDLPTEEAEARVKEAEKESLDARAAYLLKENIVKNVVQAGPLLKSIHAGGKASPMERNLHPLIDQRDILSIVQTNLSARHQAATNSLTSTRAQNIRALRRNQELATTLLKLVEEAKDAGSESIGDPEFQQELEELKAETRKEKKQYRIVKGVVSAIVAGSGYDWSQDEELMGLVLDEED